MFSDLSEGFEDDGEIPGEEDGEEETEENVCDWCGANPCECFRFVEAS